METLSKYITKNTVLRIVITLLILLPILRIIKDNKEIEKLRESIIQKDVLREVSDGHYQKLVNDMSNTRDILKSIKESNKELYELIEEGNKKPILHTQMEIEWKTKTDTFYVEKDGKFDIFYPNVEERFISYKGILKDSTLKGDWTFNPIKLDLVISEMDNGIFEADLKGNKWVKVNSLKVNSLPLSPTVTSKFNWKVGGGAAIDPTGVYMDIYGGVRLDKLDILGRIQPSNNTQIGVGILYNF